MKKQKKGETKMPANANTFFIVLAIAGRLFTGALEEHFFTNFNSSNKNMKSLLVLLG